MFLVSNSEIQIPNVLSVLFKASPNSQHIRVFISTCWEFIRMHGKTLSHQELRKTPLHFRHDSQVQLEQQFFSPAYKNTGSHGCQLAPLPFHSPWLFVSPRVFLNLWTYRRHIWAREKKKKALNKHLSELLLSTLVIRHVVRRNSRVSAYLHLAESKAREPSARPPQEPSPRSWGKHMSITVSQLKSLFI